MPPSKGGYKEALASDQAAYNVKAIDVKSGQARRFEVLEEENGVAEYMVWYCRALCAGFMKVSAKAFESARTRATRASGRCR